MPSQNMNSFAWPDSSLEFSCDDPMADTNSAAFCCLDWMRNHCAADGVLAYYYSRAADKIIEHRLSLPQSNSDDGLFMPVTYLYRHSIELRLKELIRFFISTGELSESSKLEKLLQRSHSLSKLWIRIDPIIRKLDSSNDDPAADHVSSFLERLDACDPGGTSMRYSRSSNGSLSSNLFPDRVDLVKLRDSVRRVSNFLEGSLDYASALHNQ